MKVNRAMKVISKSVRVSNRVNSMLFIFISLIK